MTRPTRLVLSAALLCLAPWGVAQANAPAEEALAAFLQEGTSEPFQLLAGLAQLEGLDAQRGELLRALIAAGPRVSPLARQLLRRVDGLDVAQGELLCEFDGSAQVQLPAGTLELAPRVRVRLETLADGSFRLHVAEGIEFAAAGERFALRTVELERADGDVVLMVGRGAHRRTLRLSPAQLRAGVERAEPAPLAALAEAPAPPAGAPDLSELLGDAARTRPPLRRGQGGPAVRSLQRLLNRHRSPEQPALNALGAFGTQTLIAVRDFQRAHGLPATGRVDGATWDALLQPPADTRALLGEHDFGSPALWEGDSGPVVSELQRLLDLRRREQGLLPLGRDGELGPSTAEAVADFQATRGLAANGVVDAATWDALRGLLPPPAQAPAASTPASSGSASSASANPPSLARGARGLAVRVLQLLINEVRFGLGLPPLPVRGTFDLGTSSAVRDLQLSSGLPVTGSVDPATWTALLSQRPSAPAVAQGPRLPASSVFQPPVVTTPPTQLAQAPLQVSPPPATRSLPASAPASAPAARRGVPASVPAAQPVQPVPPTAQPSAPGQFDNTNRTLVKIQQGAVEAARFELANGVKEEGGANRGKRVDEYARTAGLGTGNQWCGMFVSFCYVQAAKAQGKTFSGQTKLHSVGKVRAWFLYRSFVQSWTRTNVAKWEQERARHAQNGKTRRYMTLTDSRGARYAANKGLQAEVYDSYSKLPIRPGDWVVWSRGGGQGHIGMVLSYDARSGQLKTIEGNVSNKVMQKSYDLTKASERARLDGFGRPAPGDFR